MKLFLYENHKVEEYYNDKLNQLLPKIDKFLDLGHKVQERYANVSKKLDRFQEDKIWQFVEEIINRENKFLEKTQEIKELKDYSIKTGKIYQRLESDLKQFEKEIEEAIVYASTVDAWLDNNGI